MQCQSQVGSKIAIGDGKGRTAERGPEDRGGVPPSLLHAVVLPPADESDQQGYLTKFPHELVELLSTRFARELSGDMQASVEPSLVDAASSGRHGYIRDAERRLAIERHAVAGAKNARLLLRSYSYRR